MGIKAIKKIKEKINQINNIDIQLKQMKKLRPLASLQFEVHLAEHCNLNCKGCDNFSCIAEPSFLDLDCYEKDMQRLSELCCGEAKRIHLMGGEPLLHSDVPRAVKISRDKFPYAAIDIYTNGLLLTSQDEYFWSVLREENVGIMVTQYPIAFDYKSAERVAVEHGVRYQYCLSPEDEKGLFHFTLDLEGQQNELESFLKCHRGNACIALKNGKLYTCSLVANIEHFNKKFNEDLPVTERNYIDIYKAKDLQEILNFLAQPIPFCRFCDIGKDTKVYSWQQTNKEKAEWT